MSLAASCSSAILRQASCQPRQASRARPAAPATGSAAASATRPQPAPQRPALRRRRSVTAQAASSSSSGGSGAPPAAVDKQLEVLRRACRSKDVPPEEVLAAMQAVEAAHAQQPLVQGFPAALTGTWRLVFSTPSPIKQWQYIPVLENAVIDADAGTVSLDSVVGPLDNSFKGRCSFKSDAATGSFKMHFGFSASEAKWFGRWETKSELTEKRKTYTFFLLTDDVAAANSSGGPKTLMYRVRE